MYHQKTKGRRVETPGGRQSLWESCEGGEKPVKVCAPGETPRGPGGGQAAVNNRGVPAAKDDLAG